MATDDLGQYMAAAAAAGEPARRYERWKEAGRPPAHVEDDAVCGSAVIVDEEDSYPCRAPSRFIVERSDGDTSWGELGGAAEACEEHLAETVAEMVGGDDDVRIVVTLRWDKPPEDEQHGR